MFSDFRHAVRILRQAPGFTLLVVVVLAIGIGATTSIFSIVDGVLLKPLPFPDPERLIAIQSTIRGGDDVTASVPDIIDMQAAHTVNDVVGYTGGSVTLSGRGEAKTLLTAFVTGDLMRTLGVPLLRGRSFTADDVRSGAAPVAVISERLWAERFGRQQSAVGATATIDGQSLTIIGVAPDSFDFPIQARRVEAWLPIAATQIGAQFAALRGAHLMHTIARLRPDTSVEQAAAELDAIGERLAREYPKSNAARTLRIAPLQEQIVREHRTALTVLLAAVAGVLLIACANVANLLLARGIARRREIAIRSALGAGRGRIVRQLLIESALLAMVAGAAGILLSQWGVAAIVAASPLDIPRLQSVRVDPTVLLFAALLSAATGVAFGIIPAFQVSRADAGETLKGTTGGIDVGSARTRQMLVAGEVALSVVLLVGAGLLGRTLINLERVDVGFVVERALAMEISLPDTRYPSAEARIAFYRRTMDALRAIPGVQSAGASSTLPLSGNDMGIGFRIEGRPVRDEDHANAAYHAVSPDYFATMGIRLLRGRVFSERDDERAAGVMVISDTMARTQWPNEDPIGKRIAVNYGSTGPREVVGIVADVKESAVSEPARAEMYTPFAQTPWPFFTLVVRAERDPAPLATALRTIVTRLDPEQPPGDVQTLSYYVREATAQPRFTATLAAAFAMLATVLAGLGIYSVLAYSVAQRRREIGIRLALGARAADVRSLIVGQAMTLGAAGVVVGVAASIALTRVLASLLFGVSAADPLTFAVVCMVLLIVVAAAAYLPARRATTVDPLVALRAD
jgi:putative ABC transport system permease protein